MEMEKFKEKQIARILIIDDEEETRDIFKRQLEDDYEIETADSAFRAIEMLQQKDYQIALTDLVMPNQDGIELLQKIKTNWPYISVMVISGKASIEMAVQAMKLGAEEFIEKPVEDLDLLKLMIEKILKAKWQRQEINRLRKILAKGFERSDIVGNSLAFQKVLEKVKKVAPLDTTILISGETGSGKEVIADLIYRNSNRKDNPFVAVNCGSIPENLLESMLFGHKKGAFTSAVRDKIGYFQEAHGGTLFLDEVTETSLAFQVKLLRTLEKGIIRWVGGDKDIHINVRVIAASNKNVLEEVKNGNFREDLYYRLNVINIHIPPLRERQEDIILLANAFVKDFSEKYNKPNLTISDPVISIFKNNPWNGNVRELKNAIEHSVAMASYDQLIPEDLPGNIYEMQDHTEQDSLRKLFRIPYPNAKEMFEKQYVENILKTFKGDVTKAADVSKIKRQNLYEKFRKYGLDPKEFR